MLEPTPGNVSADGLFTWMDKGWKPIGTVPEGTLTPDGRFLFNGTDWQMVSLAGPTQSLPLQRSRSIPGWAWVVIVPVSAVLVIVILEVIVSIALGGR